MSKEYNKQLIEAIMKAVGPLDKNSTFAPVVIFNDINGKPAAHVSYEAMLEIFEDYLKEAE